MAVWNIHRLRSFPLTLSLLPHQSQYLDLFYGSRVERSLGVQLAGLSLSTSWEMTGPPEKRTLYPTSYVSFHFRNTSTQSSNSEHKLYYRWRFVVPSKTNGDYWNLSISCTKFISLHPLNPGGRSHISKNPLFILTLLSLSYDFSWISTAHFGFDYLSRPTQEYRSLSPTPTNNNVNVI